MIHYRFITFLVGVFLSILATAMVIPACLDLAYQDPNWVYFLESAAITGFVGVLLILSFKPEVTPFFEVRETFVLTVSSWLAIAGFAALPFLLSGAAPTLTDAFFEALSGLTTTGATVFRNLDYAPPGLLLWRALLQWLGGIGIVVMALIILPALKIGGMQLFRSEFSDRSEKYFPRVSQISSAILYTYLLISGFCAVAYWFAGLSIFEALCLMMTTVSTGGFSTSDLSFGAFSSPSVDVIAIVFMTMGSITLLLFTRFLQGDRKALWQDPQVRVFCSLLLIASAVITVWLWGTQQCEWVEALRYGTFTVVSVLSTTGFTMVDFNGWGGFPIVFIFLMMFVGGCTGSTSGGIKIFRFQILFKAAKTQILQLRHPHGVFIPLYNKQKISETEFMSVLAFFALYILCYGALALGLSLCDVDVLSSLSGSAAALGNVGPGLGIAVSSSGYYGELPELAKWVVMVGMLVGRLELLTLLILLTPGFWRS